MLHTQVETCALRTLVLEGFSGGIVWPLNVSLSRLLILSRRAHCPNALMGVFSKYNEAWL